MVTACVQVKSFEVTGIKEGKCAKMAVNDLRNQERLLKSSLAEDRNFSKPIGCRPLFLPQAVAGAED
jgi:hypothetical protein